MWQGNEGEEWRVYKYSIRVEEAVQGKAEDGWPRTLAQMQVAAHLCLQCHLWAGTLSASPWGWQALWDEGSPAVGNGEGSQAGSEARVPSYCHSESTSQLRNSWELTGGKMEDAHHAQDWVSGLPSGNTLVVPLTHHLPDTVQTCGRKRRELVSHCRRSVPFAKQQG